MIHKDFSCEFYFIRHGESVSNSTPGFAAGKNFGAPLTDKGIGQAQLPGERLKREGVTFDRGVQFQPYTDLPDHGNMLIAMGESGRDFPRVNGIIEHQMPGWRDVPVEEVYTPEKFSLHLLQGDALRPSRRGVLEDGPATHVELAERRDNLQ